MRKCGNTKFIMNDKLFDLNEKCKILPNSPGVYLMKNDSGQIIYIGKAKNLKNRVSSYFIPKGEKALKVEKMVENVSFFDYIITDSEFEALVLECSLIKKYQPKYNILLKDSKGYSYIKITGELWPKISCVKQKTEDSSTYIGPYVSSFSVKKTVEEILKIFKLPNCKRDLSKVYKHPCLNYYINRCSGPCIRKISYGEYKKTIDEVKNFLKKGISETVASLKKDMFEASESMNFELAAKLRDKIDAIEQIKSKQKVVAYDSEDKDVIATAKDDGRVCVHVFRFKSGNLYESKNFIINTNKLESEVRAEFLTQFYENKDDIPKVILSDGKIEDSELIKKFLFEKRGKSVNLKTPKQAKALELVKMCKNNAYENLLKESDLNTKEELCLRELKDILGLEDIPERIEAYDISNLFGSDCVAGMVVFKDGRPLKSDYRRFNIGYMQDDFSAMKATLKRRFEKLKTENSDESFGKIPDLILIDGGFGQVSASKEALSEAGLKIALFGMVKDKKHRTRALTTENKEIKIKDSGRLFLFITSIQDEVHRFTVNYHRKLRNKRVKTSELESIKGVGKILSKRLLKEFKSVRAISNSSTEKLAEVKGVSRSCAESIYKYFHDEES